MKSRNFFVTIIIFCLLSAMLFAEGADPLGVNTPGWEESLAVSQDGTEIIFSYKAYDDIYQNVGYDKKGPERAGSKGGEFDLYSTRKQADGTWSEPVNLTRINTYRPEYSPNLSADGKTLLFVREVRKGSPQIFFSRKGEQDWRIPKPLPAPFNSIYSEETPCQSPDGKIILFASRRSHFFKPWMLWVSTKNSEGRFDEPRPLAISSLKTNDRYPAINPATNEVYFLSDRSRDRLFKIYVAPSSGEAAWGQPNLLNLDWPVDLLGSIAFDKTGKYLYLTCYIEGKTGFMDICVSKLKADGSWDTPVPLEDFKP